MARFTATHRLQCPFLRDQFPHNVCGQRFTGNGESDQSQADADNQAERECYRKFNNHVNSKHRKWTS